MQFSYSDYVRAFSTRTRFEFLNTDRVSSCQPTLGVELSVMLHVYLPRRGDQPRQFVSHIQAKKKVGQAKIITNYDDNLNLFKMKIFLEYASFNLHLSFVKCFLN